VAFDGDPKPSIDHVLSDAADHPAGFARVRLLHPDERETYSLSSLRAEFLPDDPFTLESQTPGVEVIDVEEVSRPGGFHGEHVIVNLPREGGGHVTINQVALVDSRTERVYALAVACSTTCYKAHRRTIEAVIDSWTVKER
jgi:hypothetical protein